MRLLPDTHVVLWLRNDSKRLSSRARSLLADPRNEVLLSAAVVLEISLKRAIGKLQVPATISADFIESGALPLAVSLEHAQAVGDLPLHHGDPFGRLLVAQAVIEGATLISADPRLKAYDVSLAW